MRCMRWVPSTAWDEFHMVSQWLGAVYQASRHHRVIAYWEISLGKERERRKTGSKRWFGDFFFFNAWGCGQVHIARKTIQVQYYRHKLSYSFVLQRLLCIQLVLFLLCGHVQNWRSFRVIKPRETRPHCIRSPPWFILPAANRVRTSPLGNEP